MQAFPAEEGLALSWLASPANPNDAARRNRTISEGSSACFAVEGRMESAIAKSFDRVWGDAAALDPARPRQIQTNSFQIA
jgi:hypothetical protein